MRMLAGSAEQASPEVMEKAAEQVDSGSTVASALEQYSERFPLTFIETIRAGEQSGTLDRSFERLHKYYDKAYKTTEKIRSALMYPMFVVAVAVVVLIIVMAKVIPTLANVFADLGGNLPLMTRMMIGFSDFFEKWWLVMLGVLFLIWAGLKFFGRTKEGKIWKRRPPLRFLWWG